MALMLMSAIPVAAGLARLHMLVRGAGFQPEDARFIASPTPVAVHIVGATLFSVLGAVQFNEALRGRRPPLHRSLGRWAALGGMLAALSGLWMTLRYSIPEAQQGELLRAVRLLVGTLMAMAVVLAVRNALNHQIAKHRAWMLRAYALGMGAGTQVLIMLPVTLIVGAPTYLLRDVLMTSAWVINAALAEWLIRRGIVTH
jgi:uncharacterized membrane protein